MADVIILPTAAAVPPPRPERQAEAKAEAKAAEREAATAVHLKALRDPAIFTDFSGLTTQQKFNMLQLRHCERLFQALVAFLGRSGVLVGRTLPDEDDEVHHFGPRQTLPLVAECAGLFVSTLTVGTWLQAGDPIGTVYEPFTGRLRAAVRAPVSGLLSGLRCQPLLCEGDLVARIQTREPVAVGAETFLYGHGQ